MGDIIDISKYKRKNNIVLPKLNEEDMAKQILESFNYNNQNMPIPIVQIAKNYGFTVYREKYWNEETSIAGKLFIGGTTEEIYDHNQVILVNYNDHIFNQRIVVARMLGYYLMDLVKKEQYRDQRFLLSDILYYEEIYDKYEDFILNILAPNQIFIRRYVKAAETEFSRTYVNAYLKNFFEVSDEFVYKKIKSLR